MYFADNHAGEMNMSDIAKIRRLVTRRNRPGNYEKLEWFTPESLATLGFKMEDLPLVGDEYGGYFALQRI